MKRGTGGGANISSVIPGGKTTAGELGLTAFSSLGTFCANDRLEQAIMAPNKIKWMLRFMNFQLPKFCRWLLPNSAQPFTLSSVADGQTSQPHKLIITGMQMRSVPPCHGFYKDGAVAKISTIRPFAMAGFTLIEMVVVVAIVGILASAAIPMVQLGEHRLKERELRHALREIRTAIDAYRKATDEGRIARQVDATGYPPNLEVLAEGVADAKTPDGKKIYFLRRIPRDPFVPPDTPQKDMWGLRSYASSADDPKAGNDVFDVYSLNPGTGSNGAAYRDW